MQAPEIDLNLPRMECRFLFKVHFKVETPLIVGDTPFGHRVIAPIIAGTFSGPEVQGAVLNGSDWLLRRPDGVVQMDVRVTLKSRDDAIIYMRYEGVRHGSPEIMAKIGKEIVDPKLYYMRIRPVFETGDSRYTWLNNVVSIGYGERRPDGPIYTIYQIFEQD
jgi:Protein of unknown function (DUF3237)